MSDTIKIGADEDFEYAKAVSSLAGERFYTEIWNDQPLLHTLIITWVLKYVSSSVLGPRVCTSVFTGLLLFSLFFLVKKINGLFAATMGTILLIMSPGFMELEKGQEKGQTGKGSN